MSQVLVVGAGPTGLVLALWLAKCGVGVRIVDEATAPGQTSRAIAVHARTLEHYRQLGVADDILSTGIVLDHLTIQAGGRRLADVPLGNFGKGLSPYPYVLTSPQDEEERVLLHHLEREGVQVERGTKLVSFRERHDGVRATLSTRRGEELIDAEYLCGCDGASSTVRDVMGVGFEGGTYPEVFYVADVRLTDGSREAAIQISMGETDFTLVIPVRRTGTFRLIGMVPPDKQPRDPLTFEDVEDSVTRNTGLHVDEVTWFSSYRVHHRVAAHFRRGRAFLVGDAAHIHSPAGGQGMNTGVGDAVNLAWKLAAVLRGAPDRALLTSYEVERLAFARSLVASTDRAFRLLASRTKQGTFLRLTVLPRLMRSIGIFRPIGRLAFKRVSQIGVDYPESQLSVGLAGRVHAGDRLPWLDAPDGDNFEPLESRDWQIHVYGDVKKSLSQLAARWQLSVYAFPWSERAGGAGFARDAFYLVRPDGHVGLAVLTQDVDGFDALTTYCESFVRPAAELLRAA